MEKLDFTNSHFTFSKMLPEADNELTCLWGRKLAHNLANAYGLIGTIRITGPDWHWINLGLTKRFQFPPSCEYFLRYSSQGETLYYDSQAWFASKQIAVIISGDNVGFKAHAFEPGGYQFPFFDYEIASKWVDIFFRFYGV